MKRIRCAVPFCRRTRRDDGSFTEWICQEHWVLTSARLRRIYSLRKRRIRRLVSHHDIGREIRAKRRTWQWLKRQAIERAAGIT